MSSSQPHKTVKCSVINHALSDKLVSMFVHALKLIQITIFATKH